MGIRRIAVTSVLALALLGSSILAAGFENTGVGVKARAMGGAFRAVADDWSAAMYNPAGYAFLEDNQVGGNAAFLHLRNELTPNYRIDGQYELGVFNDVTMYNQHEVLSNPSAGIVLRLPVWGETVFGFSAYQRFDYDFVAAILLSIIAMIMIGEVLARWVRRVFVESGRVDEE